MSTLSINLPDDIAAAAAKAVASGRFADVGEYIATLIREDQVTSQDPATEALLLKRLQGAPAAEMTDGNFDRIRDRLEAEIVRRRVR